MVRQIGGQERARFGPGRRADVMLHLRQRNARGVRITQHHHAQGIAHQDQRDAYFIQKTRRRKIVGGKRGDFFAASLHGPDGFGGDFGANHR